MSDASLNCTLRNACSEFKDEALLKQRMKAKKQTSSSSSSEDVLVEEEASEDEVVVEEDAEEEAKEHDPIVIDELEKSPESKIAE
eukprot:s1730_g10.t1